MSLLFSRRPLVLNPELAARIGLNEAILLQQLHYWMKETTSGISHDNRRWIYNTLDGWREQFPFMSESTIKRGFSSLKRMGIVLVEKLSEDKHDKTNYYSIVYESRYLSDEVKLTSSNGSICTDRTGQTDPIEQVNVTQSIGSICTDVTETTTEITTDINPTHNACEEVVEPDNKNPVPEYAGQPGVFFPASQMIGKFPMSKDWAPSPDFRQRAAYWGQPVPESMDRQALLAALASFTDYWISESKVFSQTQWEQKLARHLQNARPTQPRGNNHAGLDPNSTANPAVQKIRAARAQWERERAERLGVLGASGGNLLQPLDGQKRLGPVGPMDCSDWEFDQRPDDERL